MKQILQLRMQHVRFVVFQSVCKGQFRYPATCEFRPVLQTGATCGGCQADYCLSGDYWHERDRGVDGLVEIYKEKLAKLFGDRFLQKSRTLKNSKNSALLEFLFCVGNERGVCPAKRIAKHILEHM